MKQLLHKTAKPVTQVCPALILLYNARPQLNIAIRILDPSIEGHAADNKTRITMKALHAFALILTLPITVACSTHSHANHGHRVVKTNKVVHVVKAPRLKIGFNVVSLPRAAVKVTFGGAHYHYHGGYFYRKGANGYKVVVAPVGARVTVLPSGYKRIRTANKVYFAYEGTYYVRDKKRGDYVVVKRPNSITIKHA